MPCVLVRAGGYGRGRAGRRPERARVDEPPQKEAVKTQVQLPGSGLRRIGQGRAAVALTARS